MAIGSTIRSCLGRGLFVGIWFIGGAAIALALTCLPIATGTSGAVASPPATMSNLALKGDRLISAHRKTDGRTRREYSPGAKGGAKLPIGCDVEFSRRVGADRLAGRCITGIDASMKVALAQL